MPNIIVYACYPIQGVHAWDALFKELWLSQGSFTYLGQVKKTGFMPKALSARKRSLAIWSIDFSRLHLLDWVPVKLILFIAGLQNTVLYFDI